MNFDLLIRCSDCHAYVDRDAATDFKHDAGLLVRVKARGGNGKAVGAGDESGEDVDACAVASGGMTDLGCGIGDGDGGIGDNCSGSILDGALHVRCPGDLRFGLCG